MVDRESAQDFVRQANSILNATARSLEQIAFDEDTDLFDDIQDVYLNLQKIVFRFKSTSGRLHSEYQYRDATRKLLSDLESFLSNKDSSILDGIRIRLANFKIKSPQVYLHPALHMAGTFSSGNALHFLVESLRAATNDQPFIDRSLDIREEEDVESIRKSIPVQKISAAQFDVIDGKLVVSDQRNTPKESSIDPASQGLDTLLDQASRLIDSLNKSNFDIRLKEKLEDIQEILKSNSNAIKLGLENIVCRAMTGALRDELPEAVAAEIEGFSTGIAMYVAQFEEWQIFVQNAAEAAISEESRESLTGFVSKLLSEFSFYKDVVDENVPKTIKFLSDLVRDPKLTSKRAAFAFIRTIENLIIKSFSLVIETFSKTAEKSSEKISEMGSTIITRCLIAVGIVSALGIMPISSQVKGMEWINGAYRVINEQIAPKLGGF